MGQNYGPIFRFLWTKVNQIISADAGGIVVCNTVYRLSISCSIPEIFAIEVRSRPKSRQKSHFDREYLRNGTIYLQSENGVANYDYSRVCWHNLVNFGPQTAKNKTIVWRLLNTKFFFLPKMLKPLNPFGGALARLVHFLPYGMWKFEVEVLPNGWEIVLQISLFSMGLNYGPVSRRLWTKVYQIMSADAREIVVCNNVFRLSISCSVPEIFAIEVRSRPKSRQKACFSAPIFFWGGRTPNVGPIFF